MTDEITRNPPERKRAKDPAPHGQLVTFILTDRNYMYHRTIAAARAERDFLTAKTGKEYKLLKIVSCSSDEILDGVVTVSRDGEPFEVPRE
jgi:hypothetical protein